MIVAAVLVWVAIVAWPRRDGAARWDAGADGRHVSVRRSGDSTSGPSASGPSASGPSSSGAARSSPGGADRLTVDDVVRYMALVAATIKGGAPVVLALDHVADIAGPAAASELRTVATALRWGIPDDEAWAAVSPDWADLAGALALARRAGIPPAGPLLAAAREARARQASRREIAAARLTVHLVLPLGLAYLPGFVLTTIVPVLVVVATQLALTR